MARNNSHQISQYDWILDSATASHICVICDAFIDYTPLKDSTIKGLGDPVMAHRCGTVLVDFAVNGTGTCGDERRRVYNKRQKGNYNWEGQSIWKIVHTGSTDTLP